MNHEQYYITIKIPPFAPTLKPLVAIYVGQSFDASVRGATGAVC
jgi:hypothetical protein